MLSIKALKLSDENYYLDPAEDYYFGGVEPPGQWIVGGCKYLGLSGTVTRDASLAYLRVSSRRCPWRRASGP